MVCCPERPFQRYQPAPAPDPLQQRLLPDEGHVVVITCAHQHGDLIAAQLLAPVEGLIGHAQHDLQSVHLQRVIERSVPFRHARPK